MAQGVLETGWGSNVKGNNYFGIKGEGQAFTTHEEVDGLMVKQKDKFRTYDSLEDSVRDYGLFLQENKRYRPLLEAKTLDQQIDALAGSGYATDSKYGDKIRGIIEGKTFKELIR
jgi:flagellum-specific peptidoglycan hydrolase FlgJ